jgi:hypothetical protein
MSMIPTSSRLPVKRSDDDALADAMKQLSDLDRGRLTPGQRASLDAGNRALAMPPSFSLFNRCPIPFHGVSTDVQKARRELV